MVKPLSAATQAQLALPYGLTIPAVIDATRSLGEILLVHAYILRRDGIPSLLSNQHPANSQSESAVLDRPLNGDAKSLPKSRSSSSRRQGGST